MSLLLLFFCQSRRSKPSNDYFIGYVGLTSSNCRLGEYQGFCWAIGLLFRQKTMSLRPQILIF